MPELKFTVDSALLRELGERLVGRPHIALAELVKNGYDADADQVVIEFLPDEKRIKVRDDGHGMTFNEFRDFWMRIGTPHKSNKRFSRIYKRPLTGSKGVGRLSVQILASGLILKTVPYTRGKKPRKWIEARVNWDKAIATGDLTSATVEYIEHRDDFPFEKGTELILDGLRHEWTTEEMRDLAREIWWLQPPFRRPSDRIDRKDKFLVEFKSTQLEYELEFEKQLNAIFDIWTARLVGHCENGVVHLSIEFHGSRPKMYTYSISDFPHNQKRPRFNPKINLNHAEFEIRIYTLERRQPKGIKVQEARKYFDMHGGVHVYDGGFRLPYYGLPEADWLRIEYDHAHRLFVSHLLPEELNDENIETQRLRFLPTLGRVFGIVNVNTSSEQNLKIVITRDRLADSVAFSDLAAMVRYALDMYAYEEARRQYQDKLKDRRIENISSTFQSIENVLDYYRADIPPNIYDRLQIGVREAAITVKTEQELIVEKLSLLGPLATAGISALAFQHELHKQFSTIQGLVERIRLMDTDIGPLKTDLESLADDLDAWLKRARATNSLFDYMANAENVRLRENFRALKVIRGVQNQTAFLARGIRINIEKIDPDLWLPKATLAEWGAIFQNAFTNAFHAMLDADHKLLQISSRTSKKEYEILVQDTGSGVDLRDADRLFQPFERGIRISPERSALGYGGTGLGLTIVKLIADRIGCRVAFIQPEKGFNTAFAISWRVIE
jgi:signal transduction histidine kinase